MGEKSFEIDEADANFIEAQVKGGHYRTASAVIHAGLHLLQDHEAEIDAIRAALVEGEDSGDSDRTVEDIWAGVLKRRGLV